jgi:hypothetical protein
MKPDLSRFLVLLNAVRIFHQDELSDDFLSELVSSGWYDGKASQEDVPPRCFG